MERRGVVQCSHHFQNIGSTAGAIFRDLASFKVVVVCAVLFFLLLGIDGKLAVATMTMRWEGIRGNANAVVSGTSHPFVKPTLTVLVPMDIHTTPAPPVLHSYECCVFWGNHLWQMVWWRAF